MDIFITSAVLYASHFGGFDRSHIFMNERRNNISFSLLGPDNYEPSISAASVRLNETAVLCSALRTDRIQASLLAANALLEQYILLKNHNFSNHYSYDFEFSCLIYDSAIGSTILLSDLVGSNPLWYSFRSIYSSEPSFIVSNDLLSASNLGFIDFTAVSSGSIITIAVPTTLVTDVSHYQSQIMQPSLLQSDRTELSEIYAKHIYDNGLSSVKAIANSHESLFTVFVHEADELKPSSLLLHCLLNRMKMNHIVIKRPANAVAPPRTKEFEIFHSIMDSFLNSILRNGEVAGWSNRDILKIAVEKWNTCATAGSRRGYFSATYHAKKTKLKVEDENPSNITTKVVVLSDEIGLFSDYMGNYFLNRFCRIFNVHIHYVFNNIHFQKAVWSSIYPKSFLYQSTEILSNSQLCTSDLNLLGFTNALPESISEGIRIFSIDKPHLQHEVNFSNPLRPSQKKLITKEEPNAFFSSLYDVAKVHASPSGILALLVVTSGYLDLLANFLCAAQAPTVNFKHFLVVTSSVDVCEFASNMSVGCYISRGNTDTSDAVANYSASHEFGTLSYQKLMFSRTEAAMELLSLGYHPIIADIDAVWIKNPLPIVYGSINDNISTTTSDLVGDDGTFDVAIVDDEGEVCGCFVALRSNDNTLLFWKAVLAEHRALAYNDTRVGDSLDSFTDSEQKVLTRLIYGKIYRGSLKINRLPFNEFPSGFRYFNWQIFSTKSSSAVAALTSSDVTASYRETARPAVIHNNFVIGKEFKTARFMRYLLWKQQGLRTDNKKEHSFSNLQCSANDLHSWSNIFPVVSKDITIPSLTIVLPIHNSQSKSSSLLVQVSKEEFSADRVLENGANNKTASIIKRDLRIYYESDPPNFSDFDSSGIFELNIEEVESAVTTVTAIIKDTNIAISVDVGVDRSYFASSSLELYALLANERVLRTIRETENEEYRYRHEKEASASSTTDEGANSNNAPHDAPNLNLSYHIKVLTYSRPESLLRLLTSLENARYPSTFNISLEILVDGHHASAGTPQVIDVYSQTTTSIEKDVIESFVVSVMQEQTEEDISHLQLRIDQVVDNAKNFVWTHGSKM